ncbi:uncharacterized protein LOC124789326 isoform X2 [Schistocerca piceifrons]|uniref:uncharacterized protein LOC124789326 isoform X2 n=1 Tax=Schistocerca piceifrons TaxID=274613 RepID=UPI001F5FD664|nr:uncharacterized protein LOC124789326 isoform X2 [Schistocerca piceifrons]
MSIPPVDRSPPEASIDAMQPAEDHSHDSRASLDSCCPVSWPSSTGDHQAELCPASPEPQSTRASVWLGWLLLTSCT